MRTLAACLFLVAAGLGSAQTAAPAAGPSRAEVKAVERLCDKAIETYGIDTIEQITHARALHIEGYGVVISFEVDLSKVSPLVGFAGGLSKAQKDRIRGNKLKRLPEFRQFLEGLLLESVKPLDHLSPEENLLLNVDFDYADYEDSDGLPDSISLTAKKKDLLNAAEHNIPRDQLLHIVKVKVE
jgi:hypothetical protein